MPMPPYILDYTSERSLSDGTAGPGPVVKKSVVLVAAGAALLGASLTGHLFSLSRYQRLQTSADRQALQYDSLLSAKLEADRQIADLRERLIQLQGPGTAPNPSVNPNPVNPVRHERHSDQ
jgi:hypothetical protein